MTRRLAILCLLIATGVLVASAAVSSASATRRAVGPRGAVTGIRADVTCHDPCDDPFQLKAWVAGDAAGGLVVRFSVQGRTFKARTSSGGYAHVHLDVDPADYPQGVVVSVKATVAHGGVTKSATTWFKPDYE